WAGVCSLLTSGEGGEQLPGRGLRILGRTDRRDHADAEQPAPAQLGRPVDADPADRDGRDSRFGGEFAEAVGADAVGGVGLRRGVEDGSDADQIDDAGVAGGGEFGAVGRGQTDERFRAECGADVTDRGVRLADVDVHALAFVDEAAGHLDAVVEDEGNAAVGAGRGGVDGGDDLTGQRVEGGVVDVLVTDLDDAHSPGDGFGRGLGDAAAGRFALGGVGDEVEAGVDAGETGAGGHACTPSSAVSVRWLTRAWASWSPVTAWSASRKLTEYLPGPCAPAAASSPATAKCAWAATTASNRAEAAAPGSAADAAADTDTSESGPAG